MATIDRLDIQIAGSAQKANQAIDSLITNLGKLAHSLKIDTSGLERIGKSLNFSGVDKAAKNIQSQTQKVSKSLSQITEQYKDLGKGFEIKGSTQQIQKQIDSLTNKLSNAKLAKDDFEASGKTNLGGYETAVKNVIKYTNQIESLKNQLSGLQTAQPKFDFNITSAENSTKRISDYKNELENLKNFLNSIKDISAYSKDFLDTPIQNLKQSIEELKQSYPQATNVISAFEKELQKLQSISSGLTKEPTRINLDTNSIDKINEKISELKNKFDKVGADFKFTGSFEQLNIEIEKVYSKLNELRVKEQEMISAGQVNTSGFEQLQESLARVGNKFGIMQDLRDRTEAFNQSLQQLRVPEIREENLAKLQNSLRKTEEETEKLRTKLSNAITMGKIVPNIDDSGFRKFTEQIALSEKQAEALRQKIQEVGGDTSGTGSIMDRLKSSLSNVSSQSSKTSSATNILSKNIKNLSSTMSGFSASAGKAITGMKSFARQALSAFGIYLGIYGAIRGIKKSVDIASDLTEVQNVVDVTFGDMAYKVEEFAKTSIEQFGMSELSLKQYSSRFQSMGTAMGIGSKNIEKANEFLNKQTNGYIGLSDSMSDVSLNLTKLTADMASLYNVEQKKVAQDLESVFTGMSRPLRTYGLDLTQATLQEWAMKQGIDANIQSMSQAEKTMLRYQYVLANTKAAQGDFARTANTWANQVRILKQNFEQLAAIVGGVLVNAFKPVVKAINAAMSHIISFAKTISNALGKIFGWKYEEGGGGGGLSEDFGEAADSAGDIAGSTGEAADNIKEMKAGLRAFDELKTISMPEPTKGAGSGGGGGSGGGAGGAGAAGGDWVKGDSILKEFESEIDSLYELGKYIGDTLTKALNSIDWDGVYAAADNFGIGLARFLNGLISPELFSAVGRTIANSLNTVLHVLDNLGRTFDWNNLGKSIGAGLNAFMKNLDWKTALSAASNWGKGIGNALNSFLHETDFKMIGSTVANFLNTVVQFALDLGATIEFKTFGDKLADSINEFFDTFSFKKLAKTINNWVKGALDAASSLLKKTDFDKIGKKLGEFLLELDLMSIAGKLAKVLLQAVKAAFDLLGGMIKKAPLETALLSGFAFLKFTKIGNLVTKNVAAAIAVKAESAIINSGFATSLQSGIAKAVGGAVIAFAEFKVVEGAFEKLTNKTGNFILEIGKIAGVVTTAGIALSAVFGFPAGAIAAGIIGLIGAIDGTTNAINEMEQKMAEEEQISLYGQTLSSLAEEMRSTTTAIKDRMAQSDEYINSVGVAETKMTQDLSDRYFELSEKQNKTNEEMEEMKRISSLLVEEMPELEEHYNTQTGLLDVKKKKIDELIQSRLQEIKLNAIEDQLTQAYQEQANALMELEKASVPVNDAQKEMNTLQERLRELSDKTKLLQDYDNLSVKIQNCDGDTEALIEEQQLLWNQITNGGTDAFPTYKSLQQEIIDTQTELGNLGKKYQETFNEFTNLDTTYSELETEISTLTNMLTTGMTGVAQSGAEGFSKGMENDTTMSEASIQAARDAINALNSADGFDINSPSKKTMETGKYAVEGISKGIEENKQSVIESMKKLATDVVKSFEESIITSLESMWSNTIKPQFTTEKWSANIGSIKEAVSKKWQEMNDWMKSTAITGFWSKIKTDFSSSKWKNNIGSIKNPFNQKWTEMRTWMNGTAIPRFWTKFQSSYTTEKWKSKIGSIKSAMQQRWNEFKTWWNGLKIEFPKIKMPHFSMSGEFNLETGSVPTVSVQYYAAGGFPEDGWFRASHGEIMGRFDNGQSVVANNKQITDGIAAAVYPAVYNAVSSAMRNNGGAGNGNIAVQIELDGDVVYKNVLKRTKEQSRAKFAGRLVLADELY